MYLSLAQMYDDKTLEFEVTRVFSQYGPVFVKIRRDSRQMPFAFCQFTVCCVLVTLALLEMLTF